MKGQPLLSARNLCVDYGTGANRFAAISDINLDVRKGETLGVVGESGCGKSTMGRAILQLPKPTRGEVTFDSVELTSLGRNEMQSLRSRMQIIFQDPVASLNPRRTVQEIVAEPLKIEGLASKQVIELQVETVLREVGLDPAVVLDQRPHQISGGQCQRVCIARALIREPDLIVCDEPVSALDLSVQAQILNLLQDMKDRYGLTLLFVSHDMAVVRHISDRIMVMYLGRVCEVADSQTIYQLPAHPYTSGLLSSVPELVRTSAEADDLKLLAGEMPSPVNPPDGCVFHPRCSSARPRCRTEAPVLRMISPGHHVACHYPLIGLQDFQDKGASCGT